MFPIIFMSGPPAELVKDAHRARTKMDALFCLHIIGGLTYGDA